MWTEITRAQYRREAARYASDTQAAEWEQIAPLLPPPRRLGRPRQWELRVIVDAILYLLWTGCQWRALPKDFPPYSTVQGYFYRWRDEGTWERVSLTLVARARQQAGRNRVPSVGIIDSQSVPTTESGGRAALMRPSASRGASATSSLTPRASCSPPRCIQPISKTRMARCRCCIRCGKPSPSWPISSPTASIAARNCKPRLPIAAPGRSRSSSARPASKAFSSCPAAGWSSAASPGSAAADASPRTSKQAPPVPPPGSFSPTCGCFPAAWQGSDRL
jgi:transposase